MQRPPTTAKNCVHQFRVTKNKLYCNSRMSTKMQRTLRTAARLLSSRAKWALVIFILIPLESGKAHQLGHENILDNRDFQRDTQIQNLAMTLSFPLRLTGTFVPVRKFIRDHSYHN